MNKVEYERMYQLENSHWWFLGKRRIIKSLLQPHFKSEALLLDFGCGTGALIAELKEQAQVYGLDTSPEAVKFCRERGLSNIQIIGENLEASLPPGRFDIIIASDVLEHIKDDQLVLDLLYKSLAPGGVLLVTVPAWTFLWSEHDVHLHHFRRYSKDALAAVASESGFTWSYISYYNAWLFPVVAAIRTLRKLFSGSSTESDTSTKPPRIINRILYEIFSSERYWLGRWHVPFGVSLLALVIKK